MNTNPKTNLEILQQFTSSKIPVDVFAAAKAIGISVLFDNLPQNISGKIQKLENGLYQIVLNKNEPSYRQRFTLGHELGHYMYHRSLIGDGVSDSPAYRSPDDTIYENTPLERIHERQANQFAANLLMPLSKIREIENDNPDIDVSDLAQIFGVSEDAMRIRKGLPTKRQLAMNEE